MNKYALVGKNISHSRSPDIYRRLISSPISYDLLDFENVSEIPSVKDLLIKYDGINITSPYKKHFLDQVLLTENGKKVNAINCIKKIEDIIIGDNTDYLAIIDILKKLLIDQGEMDVVILGDGVMSSVAEVALRDLSINYKILSRKITEGFDQLNLFEYFSNKNSKPLIINTCSRDYIFSGKVSKEAIFWDFNYSFPQHALSLPDKVYLYMDGIEMLERQAFHAVAFWSSHNLPKSLK